MIHKFYKDNRPLFYSLITGLLYFLFCWSIDFGDEDKILFVSLMLFLPGLTFPLSTCYFHVSAGNKKTTRIFAHLVLSVVIYHGSVWLYSGEARIKYITILAGFAGSLLFLVITRLLLKKAITVLQIVLTALISGIVFLPYELVDKAGLFLGIAVCLWTIVNGLLLNLEFKRHLVSALPKHQGLG